MYTVSTKITSTQNILKIKSFHPQEVIETVSVCIISSGSKVKLNLILQTSIPNRKALIGLVFYLRYGAIGQYREHLRRWLKS